MYVWFYSVCFTSRRPQSRISSPTKLESSTNKKNDDDEDNWDLPEEDAIPY